MKKLLQNPKALLSIGAVAVLAVACGLKFTNIVIDDKEPAQGQVITLTADMEQEGDNNTQDLYHFLAVRVPQDWEGVSATGNPNTDEERVYDMEECAPYAKFCEFCFPKAGYKWVAFQSKDKEKQGGKAIATAKLKVGNKTGSYKLDVLSGGWGKEPSELLLANGDINLSMAFGNDVNFEKASMPDSKAFYNSSEYLFIAGTISDEEYNASKNTLAAKYKTDLYGEGTKPVVPDIANINSTFDLTVNVKESTGISLLNAGEGETEYFNLNGVKVENPENGVFIYRKGGKSGKIVK